MFKHSKLALVTLSLSIAAGTAFLLAGPAFAAPTDTPAATVSPTPVGNPTLDFGISVAPVKFIFDANPGETLKGQLTYYNATGTDLTLYEYTLNFKSDNNSGNPQFIKEDLPASSSLKDWIHFENDSFFIKKVVPTNTNAHVLNFTIVVPANAEAGGHYASILATINDPKKKLEPQGGNIAFSADTGSLILLNVKGNVNRNLSLTKFTTVDPFSKNKNEMSLFEWMPVEFMVGLQNTGNTHAFPMGDIIVYQGEKQIQKMIFNDAQSAILRESSRQYFTDMTPGFIYLDPVTEQKNGKQVPVSDSNGNTETQLKLDSSKLNQQFFGPFTAKLLLVYDDNGQKKTIIAEKEFWVLPWKVIALILALIILYAVIRIRSGRREKY